MVLCLFPLEKCNCFPLNMQSGNRNLVIFTSDLSAYEDSNCFSLMEIKPCLPCQLLNVEIAAGCGIKYLIYSATLWKAIMQELYGFVWYKSFIWEEKQQPAGPFLVVISILVGGSPVWWFVWYNDGNSELEDELSVILSLSQCHSFLSAELTGAELSVIHGVFLLFLS